MVSIGWNDYLGLRLPYIDYGQGSGYIPIEKKIILGSQNIKIVPRVAPSVGASIFSRIPSLPSLSLPSIGTTAKVVGTGAIAYTGYKASESVGRFFDTGSFTKKELASSPPNPSDLPPVPGIQIYGYSPGYPQGEGFWGNLGAGIGQGATATGQGIGSGLDIALPVLAIGGLAYLVLKTKRKKK